MSKFPCALQLIFLRLLKVENHVKIPFVLLSNQVLSRLQLQVKNVKISSIVLCNLVLSRFEVENHVEIVFP